MVGDRWLDVACGQAAGTRSILVRTGHGAHEEAHAAEGRRRAGCYPQQSDGGRRVDSAQLRALVTALKGRAVAVVGDVVADEFVYGRVARVSREAPVLILEYDSTEVVAGGAGNAANNVAALGGRACARRSGRTRRAWPPPAGLAASPCRSAPACFVRRRATPVKTRILAGGIHSAKQQVVRIDRALAGRIDAATANSVRARRARREPERGRGAALRLWLRPRDAGSCAHASGARSGAAGSPIPVLVDTRYRLLSYKGLTACTPNESEVEQALGVRINDDSRVLERAGREILARTRMEAVLITRGSRGMALFVPGTSDGAHSDRRLR